MGRNGGGPARKPARACGQPAQEAGKREREAVHRKRTLGGVPVPSWWKRRSAARTPIKISTQFLTLFLCPVLLNQSGHEPTSASRSFAWRRLATVPLYGQAGVRSHARDRAIESSSSLARWCSRAQIVFRWA